MLGNSNNSTGATTSGASTVMRPSSPATPKRSRKDLGIAEDDTFDDISPIASPHMLSPRTTPKRRRSQAPGGRSLLDLFSSLREDSGKPLAMSVDFSNMGSLAHVQPDVAMVDESPSTPVSRRHASPVTPSAPRKPSGRSSLSRSCPNLVVEMPAPRKLDFGGSDHAVPSDLDYSAIMSIVGFVSSFITRTGRYDVPIDDLATMLESCSNNFKSRESALRVLTQLAHASPQWIRTDSDGMFHFETSVKSFDVLNELRIFKRNQLMTL